jgi:hypothetical protein
MQSHGRPKKERKGKIQGPKGATAAAIIAKPAKDSNNKV